MGKEKEIELEMQIEESPIPLLKIFLSRPMFLWSHRVGRTLDVGSNDGSLIQLGHYQMGIEFNRDNDWLYSFDCDRWELPNFTRGDAHRIPFKDNAFETIVLGDVLEHVPDPIMVLKECDRICSDRIVISLPNESEWSKDLNPYNIENMDIKQTEAVTLHHPSIYTKCTDYVKETTMKHLPHIRSWDYWTIYELLKNGLSGQYKIHISNYSHELLREHDTDPLKGVEYWGIFIDKKTDMRDTRFGITDIG